MTAGAAWAAAVDVRLPLGFPVGAARSDRLARLIGSGDEWARWRIYTKTAKDGMEVVAAMRPHVVFRLIPEIADPAAPAAPTNKVLS